MKRSPYRTEMARLWREPRLRWMSGMLVLLMAVLFTNGWLDASRLQADRVALESSERSRWLAQGDKDPHSAAHWGVWAAKPSSPLAVLEPGIEPYVGLSVWLEAHKRNDMIFRPQQEADPLLQNALSVARLMAWIGPVVAILLGFSGFAEDRQKGMLVLALGNGTAPARLLAVRLAAMSSLLFLLVVAPPLLMCLPATFQASGANWQNGLRLLLWGVVQWVYLLTFLLLALGVSMKARSPSTALAILLVLWALLCLLLPRAASDLSQSLAPLPSYQQVRSQIELEAPAYENAERWGERRRTLLAAAGALGHETPPIDIRGAMLDQSERDAHRVIDRIMGSFHDAVQRQDDVFGWLGAITPTVSLQSLGAALAGTDFHQHRHFIDAAEAYRRRMVNQMNGELMHRTGPDHQRPPAGQVAWDSVPAFDYQPVEPLATLAQVTAPLLLLLAWCAAAAGAVVHAARGLKP